MYIETDTLFRILADPTRLRILLLLVDQDELCVCELTHALDEIQPKISRHLALLREASASSRPCARMNSLFGYYGLRPGADLQ